MLFVYECTGNIIAEFKKFYDTQLSEQDKKKIFIPTYDCMKRYQGSWHVEQKPLFTDCFFIECRDKEELKTTLSRQHCSDSLAEAVMSGINLQNAVNRVINSLKTITGTITLEKPW